MTAEHSGRFTGKAAEYAQFRERYEPEIILPLLREWCGLKPQWIVADIGAGTGMAGEVFRANGNPVIAVEPNTEMRDTCASLHAADSMFSVIDGSAEATGLPAASVEMIAIGRALHWFDVDAAMRECRRILKPRGWVAILASGRSEDGRDENIAFLEVLRTSTGRYDAIESRLRVYRQLPELFAGGAFHNAEVADEMRVTWEELRGLTHSFSYAPAPGSPESHEMETALRNFFERYEREGKLTFTSKTWVSAGQFAEM